MINLNNMLNLCSCSDLQNLIINIMSTSHNTDYADFLADLENAINGDSPSGDKYAMLIKNENNTVLYIFVYGINIFKPYIDEDGIRRRLSPNFVMVHSDTSYDFKPLSKEEIGIIKSYTEKQIRDKWKE